MWSLSLCEDSKEQEMYELTMTEMIDPENDELKPDDIKTQNVSFLTVE